MSVDNYQPHHTMTTETPTREGIMVHWTETSTPYTIHVCVDCYYAFDGFETEDGHAEAFAAAFDQWEGLETVMAGSIDVHDPSYCPNVNDDGNLEWVEDCECEQTTFTWSACDWCGSGLGGAREAMTVWVKN